MRHDDEDSSAMQLSSPSGPSGSITSSRQTHKPRSRNPLESLSSFVNSLEIKTVGSKISHSASSIRRSVSHRLQEPPRFLADETSDDLDDENESTLNDDDWLGSPSSKQKSTPRNMSAMLEEPDMAQQFSSNEHLPTSRIRTFTVAQDNLPRIDEIEMRKIIEGEHTGQFDEYVVIDCRFPYEYEGGHIPGAVNLSSQQALEETLLSGPEPSCGVKKLLIFHCEYSLLRGPTLATYLRKVDRQMNASRYPYLHYPDIVVLDRGYKGFYDKYKHLCEPQAYVAMKDTNHKRTCEIEMNKVLQASKLTRAKSFTQFPPRLNLAHSRSASLTALLTSSDLTNPANTAPLPRSRRSLKIKKRERKDSRPQFTQSLSSFSNAYDSPQKESPVYARFDHEDFMPPTALFRNHSKSSSGSFLSINSSSSSICSESLSPTFSSSESLSESASPFNDRPDYFRASSLYDPIDVTTPLSSMTHSSNTQEFSLKGSSFQSENLNGDNSGQRLPRSTLTRPNLRPIFKPENSSPSFSSPLSMGTAPTVASRQDVPSITNLSTIDAPVEYFLQTKNSHHPRLSRKGDQSRSSDLREPHR
ncbi:hypothetical protein OXX80_005640 [Metschnikowia pulcherrima]